MLAVERAVPIYYYSRDGKAHSASGFRIDGEYILTADHCADGTDYRVLIDDRNVSAQVYLYTGRKDVDLAILKVDEKLDVERVPCARIRTSHAERLDNCCVLAFPVWKRVGRAQLDGYVPTGEVSTLSGLTRGESDATSLLTFKSVTPAPPSPTPDGPLSRYASQWQGASGAAIVHDGHVIGVLSNHAPLEGDSSLAFTPITAIDRLDPDQRDRFRSVLGIVNDAILPTFPKEVLPFSDAFLNAGNNPSVLPGVDPLAQPDADTETLHQGGRLFADQGDLPQAENLWRRAASQGHPDAMVDLAGLLYTQRKLREAHAWYLKAAEQGNIEAMGHLASLLQEARQARDAERWCRAAAEAGNTDAMYNLAVMLDKTGHFGEAITWYRHAAEAEHPDAMHNLAIRLRARGELAEATIWWQRAGHRRAQRISERPRGPVRPRRTA